MQHWQDAPYAAWKVGQVQAALRRAGFDAVPTDPIARTPPGVRRRVDLALQRAGAAVHVGLHRHRAAEVVALHVCLVLDPALVRLLDGLRALLPGLAAFRRTGSAEANLLDSGIDLVLRTDGPLSAPDRTALAAFAATVGACRVSWGALGRGPVELACQLTPPLLTLGGATVAPPPGAFLQASPQGEAAIRAAVLAGLPPPSRRPVVELFAGIGTLTFALAARARVVAYEGDAAAHAALRRAAAGRNVSAVHRDLARQPLGPKELAGVAAIVLDPPFGGAAAQMPGIAASGVGSVIYVSCNPAALARDARLLAAAGYQARRCTPVDQFLWSSAVESVTVFQRRTSSSGKGSG